MLEESEKMPWMRILVMTRHSLRGEGGGLGRVFAGICCLLLLARRLFDQAGELAMVVFEETEDAAGLGLLRRAG